MGQLVFAGLDFKVGFRGGLGLVKAGFRVGLGLG